jgi:hypothetical protein
MNYIILGKSLKKGVSGNDSSTLSNYFELGWEVVGSRFDFIKLIKTHSYHQLRDYTMVTSEDRVFFYSKLFHNVISYDEFKNLNLTNSDTVDDWTITRMPGRANQFSFNSTSTFIDKNGKYVRHDEDYEELFNGFDLSKSTIEKPDKYIVLNLRSRDHNNYKNFSHDSNFYKNLIKKIKSQLTENIFVVGYGTESFCLENKCTYVEKLVDFVSLIKDKKRCISNISQTTGTVALSILCSETPIHILDNTGASDLTGNEAILGGKPLQLCKDKIILYTELNDDTIDEIIETNKSTILLQKDENSIS